MRQQINLYPFIAEEKKFELTLMLTIWIVGAFIALVLLNLMMQLWHVHVLKSDFNLAQTVYLQKKQELTRLTQQYPSINPDDLTKSIEKLEEELSANETLINFLFKHKDFSSSLIALAHATYPGVWLTEIKMIVPTNQVILQGYALQTDSTQQFLTQIMQQPIFAQKTFVLQTLKEVSMKDAYLISFEIANKESL